MFRDTAIICRLDVAEQTILDFRSSGLTESASPVEVGRQQEALARRPNPGTIAIVSATFINPAMPLAESLATAALITGATVVTFVVVSFTEVRAKIDQQIAAGEDPYELRVDREKPKKKKSKSSQRK